VINELKKKKPILHIRIVNIFVFSRELKDKKGKERKEKKKKEEERKEENIWKKT
jgi:hypothetical protein